MKGDGVAKNFTVSATVLVWDTRISNSYRSDLRKASAAKDYVVTDANEKQKQTEKGEVCKQSLQGRAEFLPVVANTHGALGRRAWKFLRDGFQRKIDEAMDPTAKHAARLELMTSLVEMNVAVFVRNSMIMSANATAQGGGSAPQPSEGLCDRRRDEVMQECD